MSIETCPKCGQHVDTDSRFCKHCGFDLAQVSQRSRAQAIPAEGSVATSTVSQRRFKFAKALLVGVAWLLYLPIAGILLAQVFRHLRVNNILVFRGEEMAAAVLALVSSFIIFPILVFVKRKSFFEQELVSTPQYGRSHNLPPAQQPVASTVQRNQAFKILGTLAAIGLLVVIGLVSFVGYMVHRANDDRIVFEPPAPNEHKERARRVSQSTYRITQIIPQYKGSMRCDTATSGVELRITNGERNEIPTFYETHRDYGKIKNLRPGQEIRFEYSDVDGDPTCEQWDGNYAKYLRLSSVR